MFVSLSVRIPGYPAFLTRVLMILIQYYKGYFLALLGSFYNKNGNRLAAPASAPPHLDDIFAMTILKIWGRIVAAHDD